MDFNERLQNSKRNFFNNETQTQPVETPFVDPNYNISEWSRYVQGQRLNSLTINETMDLNRQFLESIPVRIDEIKSFFVRNGISIDCKNDSYEEFEIFILKNIYSDKKDMSRNLWSDTFWTSILVDFTLLIVEEKKKLYSDISIIDAFYDNSVYGRYPLVQSANYTSPLFNIIVAWGDRIAARFFHIYRYEPVYNWIYNNIDIHFTNSKKTNLVRIHPPHLEIDEYSLFSEEEYQVVLMTRKKDALISYVNQRNKSFSDFLSKNNIEIDLKGLDFRSFENFTYNHIDFDVNDNQKMNPLWKSIMIDFSLLIGSFMSSLDEETTWKVKKKNSDRKELNLKRNNVVIQIIDVFIQYGDRVANNSGPLPAPGSSNSLTFLARKILKDLKKESMQPGVDYEYNYLNWYRYTK
jgi:hypothetical protein